MILTTHVTPLVFFWHPSKRDTKSSTFAVVLSAAGGSWACDSWGLERVWVISSFKLAALEDDGLRSVECSEISGAACIVFKTGGEHSLAPFKVVIGVL